MVPILSFLHRKQHEEITAPSSTVLIVGLGNPGREYRESRHNVGFMVLDRLADHLTVKLSRVQNKAIIGSANLESVKLVLAKPQTFMNLSGEAVAGLSRFYKIPTDRILVIHDDIDLPFGTLRLRPSGSSAGQKGVQSIIDRLGTQDFPRLRIGVGRPPGYKQGANYVLRDFSNAEKDELEVVLKEAVQAVIVFSNQGIDQAMNLFNGPVFED